MALTTWGRHWPVALSMSSLLHCTTTRRPTCMQGRPVKQTQTIAPLDHSHGYLDSTVPCVADTLLAGSSTYTLIQRHGDALWQGSAVLTQTRMHARCSVVALNHCHATQHTSYGHEMCMAARCTATTTWQNQTQPARPSYGSHHH
jgi:hypothetical protein